MFHKKIKTVIYIEGMHCEHCANKVKKAISSIVNVQKVKINLSKKEAIIWSSQKIDISELKEKIENLDYKVINTTEESI